MNAEYKKILKCCEFIRSKTDFEPDIALILGSGLGAFADEIEKVAVVDYKDIPGFPQSTVPGHKGRFVFGYVGDVKVVIMQGRVHYYEGYSVSEVIMPVRIMKLLGAKILFLTNASGGINKDYKVGDFMLIRDHILSFFPNPVVGENIEELGERFFDMTEAYSGELRNIIKETAASLNIPLQEGVYVQLTGPSYETPSEIRMLSIVGADVVGMSSACETVAARHAGMRVCGISCVTNMAAGISKNPLSHEEVQETSNRVAPLFRSLVGESIKKLGKLLNEG